MVHSRVSRRALVAGAAVALCPLPVTALAAAPLTRRQQAALDVCRQARRLRLRLGLTREIPPAARLATLLAHLAGKVEVDTWKPGAKGETTLLTFRDPPRPALLLVGGKDEADRQHQAAGMLGRFLGGYCKITIRERVAAYERFPTNPEPYQAIERHDEEARFYGKLWALEFLLGGAADIEGLIRNHGRGTK